VSIFSDLNNLTDLTMSRKAATLLGYTQEELESNFGEYIDALAAERGESHELALEQLRLWYNGYRFHPDSETVYNPVSVMKCLDTREFKNYWFETGTPSFLIDLFKTQPLLPEKLEMPESAFSVYEPDRLDLLPLMVQTGYLTLRRSRSFMQETWYDLGYPNREVSHSFSYHLAKGLGGTNDVDLNNSLRGVIGCLRQGDLDALMKHMKVFFAGIPYDIHLDNEKYYQSLFFSVFKLLGAEVEAEVRTADGRIDAVLKTPERVVLFEFKLHDTAEAALEQIHAKNYALPYQDDGRELICIGASFDPETRNLGRWLMERG